MKLLKFRSDCTLNSSVSLQRISRYSFSCTCMIKLTRAYTSIFTIIIGFVIVIGFLYSVCGLISCNNSRFRKLDLLPSSGKIVD
jgi:hypothetical protein